MELLIERCAGLDVHKASVTATVRVPDQAGGRLQQTRSFRATTAGLVLLGDWLASFGVTVVGMESTGVYWRPVYYLLEDDLNCPGFDGGLDGWGWATSLGCGCSR